MRPSPARAWADPPCRRDSRHAVPPARQWRAPRGNHARAEMRTTRRSAGCRWSESRCEWPCRRCTAAGGHHAPEEIQPHQRRLAALPGEVDFRRVLLGDVLPHIVFQHVIRHPKSPGLLVLRIQTIPSPGKSSRSSSGCRSRRWVWSGCETAASCGRPARGFPERWSAARQWGTSAALRPDSRYEINHCVTIMIISKVPTISRWP